ncbi:MAG: pyridoxamine 5'-phosphate oxidase family protein [Acidimicrobiales bacterium]
MTEPGGEPLVDHIGLDILSPDECHDLLAATPIGRVAFVDRGEPMILPVTITVWERSVVFTTAAGSKLDAAIMNRPVAIEVDGWDADRHEGWSVLVKGIAMIVDSGREIDSLDRIAAHSWWHPEIPKAWVRVVPNEITGRRLRQPGTPA